MEEEELRRPSVTTLFKNQGVYNGLIGVLILISIYVIPSISWLVLFLAYIILVALYGSVTSDKKTRRISNFDINIVILLKTNKHESPK